MIKAIGIPALSRHVANTAPFFLSGALVGCSPLVVAVSEGFVAPAKFTRGTAIVFNWIFHTIKDAHLVYRLNTV